MAQSRIVFSGEGGQGIITAAVILAEAAALYSGLEVVQTQVYGPEARGGASRADVIISDRPVRYPKVITPHYLVCLNQASYDKYKDILKPGGLLLCEGSLVQTDSEVEARHISLPMLERIMEQIGKPVVLNICMLGAFIGLTGLLEPEALLKSVTARIPERFLEMNKAALDLGLELASQVAEEKEVA